MLKTLHPITQDLLKEILDYDPISGDFFWKKKISDKVVIGCKLLSTNDNGYLIVRLFGKVYRQHQLAFMYMEGWFPDQVDHLDHNHSNNSWNNLKASNYETNGKNHPKTKRNKTGFVGVSQRPDGKFVARIYVMKKHIFLGVFDTANEAATVRQQSNLNYGFHKNHGT